MKCYSRINIHSAPYNLLTVFVSLVSYHSSRLCVFADNAYNSTPTGVHTKNRVYNYNYFIIPIGW